MRRHFLDHVGSATRSVTQSSSKNVPDSGMYQRNAGVGAQLSLALQHCPQAERLSNGALMNEVLFVSTYKRGLVVHHILDREAMLFWVLLVVSFAL